MEKQNPRNIAIHLSAFLPIKCAPQYSNLGCNSMRQIYEQKAFSLLYQGMSGISHTSKDVRCNI